jgi:uncharacterized protein (TIGR02996 family)
MVATAVALKRAKQALADGDPAGALDALLEAWRARPLAELADLIDRVPVTSAPIASKKDWSAAVKGKQAASLGRILDELPRLGDWKDLAGWPVDPRLCRRAAAWMAEIPVGQASRKKFVRAMVAVLEGQRDPAVKALLEAQYKRAPYLAGMEEWDRWDRIIARKLPAPKPLSAAEEALASSLFGSAAKTTRDPIAAVYARPDDDGARQVVADWLAEKGDPRGEFIALQLSKQPGSKREKELEKKHGRDWLGPLGKVLLRGGVVFRRGFPAAGRYGGSKKLPAGHESWPEWATFEELDLEPAMTLSRDKWKLLGGGACKSLRKVFGLSSGDVDRFVSQGTTYPWESVHIALPYPGVPKAPLASLPTPQLTELRLDGRTEHGGLELLRTPLGKRLRHYAFVWRQPDLIAAHAAASASPSLETLTLWWGTGWARLDAHDGYRVRLRRVKGGWKLEVMDYLTMADEVSPSVDAAQKKKIFTEVDFEAEGA